MAPAVTALLSRVTLHVINFVVDTDPPLRPARPKLASGVRGAADFELNGIAQGALEVFLDRPDPLVARSTRDEPTRSGLAAILVARTGLRPTRTSPNGCLAGPVPAEDRNQAD